MEENIKSSCADIQDFKNNIIAETSDNALVENSTTADSQKTDIVVNKEISSNYDQKLYGEVLDKLEISKENKSQAAQENFTQAKNMQDNLNKPQNNEKVSENMDIQSAIAQDFDKLRKLVKSGLIDSVQEQNLKNKILKNAFDKLVQTEKIKRASQSATIPAQKLSKREVFEEFGKDNPNFFDSSGRGEVFDYLMSDNISLGKDELGKISKIIESVERNAVERYLKKVSHEKTLTESNELAKKKLTANAQRSGCGDNNLSRTFTREQIGKMNSKEFAKYEAAIMEQLKKGLIK